MQKRRGSNCTSGPISTLFFCYVGRRHWLALNEVFPRKQPLDAKMTGVKLHIGTDSQAFFRAFYPYSLTQYFPVVAYQRLQTNQFFVRSQPVARLDVNSRTPTDDNHGR